MIALTCDLAETDESRCAAKERDCDCYIAVVGPFCWVSCVVVGSWGLAPSLQTHYLGFGMYYHWTLLNLYYKIIVKASQRVIGRTLGSLSSDAFERRTSTGSEVFSLLTYLDDIKFVFI